VPLGVVAAVAIAAAAQSSDASACRLGGNAEFLRDLLFGQAARLPGAEQSTITNLKRASNVDLLNARVVAYDAQSGRIECTGDVQVTLPVEAAPVFGGRSQVTGPTRFTAEPNSDGRGFMIFISRMPLSAQIADASRKLAPTRLTPVTAAAIPTVPMPAAPAPAPAPAIKAAEAKPAFDCALAATAVETMLCGDAELAERDQRVAKQYYALRGALPQKTRAQLLRSQRLFLKQRADCSTSQCLSELYDERLRRLEELAANANK